MVEVKSILFINFKHLLTMAKIFGLKVLFLLLNNLLILNEII